MADKDNKTPKTSEESDKKMAAKQAALEKTYDLTKKLNDEYAAAVKLAGEQMGLINKLVEKKKELARHEGLQNKAVAQSRSIYKAISEDLARQEKSNRIAQNNLAANLRDERKQREIINQLQAKIGQGDLIGLSDKQVESLKEQLELEKGSMENTMSRRAALENLAQTQTNLVSSTKEEKAKIEKIVKQRKLAVKGTQEQIAANELAIKTAQEELNITQQLAAEKKEAADVEDGNNARAFGNSLLAEQSEHYTKLADLGKALATGGMAAYTAVLRAAWERFINLDKAAGEFRKTTGLITTQTKDIDKAVRQVNVDMQQFGVTLEAAYASAGELYKNLGTTALVTEALVADTAQMEANLGIASADSAKFVSMFGAMSKNATGTATGLIHASAALAEMGGVAPSEVMKDMAEASGATLSFLGKSPMQLMRASVEARRLGTTIKSIAESARGMLDYQSSINSELEASALLGQSVSFQESRLLAFQGKVVESRKAALKEISKAGDFTKLNVYQQEALAKAAGMSVDEVMKQQNQEKMLNAVRRTGTAEQKAQLAAYEKMSQKIADDEASAQKDLLARGNDMVKQQMRQSEMNKLSNAFAAIWVSITDILVPIVNVVLPKFVTFFGVIAEGVSKVSSFLNKADEPLASWGGALAFAVKWAIGLGVAVLAAIVAFKGLSTAIRATKAVSAIGGDVMGSVLGKGVGKKGGGLAKSVLGKAGKGIGGISKSISGATKSVGTGFEGFAKSIAKGIGHFGKPNVLFGVLAMIGMAAALWILGKALQEFSGLSWKTLAIAGVAIVGLGLAAAGLGYISPFVVAGAWALGILGLAMIAFAVAAFIAAKAMVIMAPTIKELVQPLAQLALVSPGLFVAASGIAAVSAAMVALGGGSAIGSLLGGDGMIDKMIALGSVGPKLLKTASAMERIAVALVKIQNIKEIPSLSAIAEISAKAAPADEEPKAVGTKDGTGNIQDVVQKLDELIGLLKAGAIAVNMDGKKVSSAMATMGT